ncbi:MAG: hypothetical protein AAGE01_11665 [Pseudomonadota bacterium]
MAESIVLAIVCVDNLVNLHLERSDVSDSIPAFQTAVGDHEISPACRHWVNPSEPLPEAVAFVAHRPTRTRTAAWSWLVISMLLVVGALGMMLVGGPLDLITTLGGAAAISGAIAAWLFQRLRIGERTFAREIEAGQWRLGRFWSRDWFLLRLQPDHCFVVPRSQSIELAIGRSRQDSGQAQGSIELWLELRCGDQRFAEFQAQARDLSVNLTDLEQALEARREAFETWLRDGDSSAICAAHRAALEQGMGT